VVTLHTHACWERACFTYLSDIWLFRLINQIIFEMPNWSAHLLFSNVILSILGKYCVIFFNFFFAVLCTSCDIYLYTHTHTQYLSKVWRNYYFKFISVIQSYIFSIITPVFRVTNHSTCWFDISKKDFHLKTCLFIKESWKKASQVI